MTRLPRIRSRELIRGLTRLGFVKARQVGSHLVLTRDSPPARVVVPVHPGKTLKLGTLAAILEEGGVSIDDLLTVL